MRTKLWSSMLWWSAVVQAGALLAAHSVCAQESAGGHHRPAQLIVKWRDSRPGGRSIAAVDALAQAAAATGITTSHVRTLATGGELLQVHQQLSKDDLSRFIAQLHATGLVEYAEEELILRPLLNPNDPRYQDQWQLFAAQASIKVPVAWDRTNGRGVTVAVLDTGYRIHPDLAPNLVPGYDFLSLFFGFDGDGRDGDAYDEVPPSGVCEGYQPHGTHVAGVAGAETGNGIGIAGVAYGARIQPVRVMDPCRDARTSDIADGLIWAAGGSVDGVPANATPARVINISLGAYAPCPDTLRDAVEIARNRGAVIVTAAGNANTDVAALTPANCPLVLAVAAVNRDGGKSSYSNFGGLVDVAAPGDGILTTDPTANPSQGNYARASGTSLAAPLVAGVAALIMSRHPDLMPLEVERILRTTARPFPTPCSGCGTGIVNARAATAPPDAGPPAPGEVNNPSRSLTGSYTVSWSASPDATHYVIEQANPTLWTNTTNVHGLSRTYTNQSAGDHRHRVKACNNYGCGRWQEGNVIAVCRAGAECF
jgi:serine protease